MEVQTTPVSVRPQTTLVSLENSDHRSKRWDGGQETKRKRKTGFSSLSLGSYAQSSQREWVTATQFLLFFCSGWKAKSRLCRGDCWTPLEAKSLPQETSAQLVELGALTWALELSKGQQVNIYTDSKYAYLTLHAHAAIWKERQFKTAIGEPIKHFKEIERLLTAI